MKDYLTLGIVAAIVAGNAQAVADMLRTLVSEDAKWASELMDAMERGRQARVSTPEPTEQDHK